MRALIVLRLACADFRERTRGQGYLLTLGAVAYLAYTVHAGWWSFRVGGFIGQPGPASTGAVLAVATGTILTLLGFYVVKGSVARDRRSGVFEVLHASPLTWTEYAGAKFVSNAAVLGSMVLVLAAAGVVVAADAPPDLSASDLRLVLLPPLFLTLPALATVAALAVLFEALPPLRGGAGNIAYFFVWGLLISAGRMFGPPWLDFTGIRLVQETLADAVLRVDPSATLEAAGVLIRPPGDVRVAWSEIPWSGIGWSGATVVQRLAWVGVGIGLTALAAPALARVDRQTAGPGARAAERPDRPHATAARLGRPPASPPPRLDARSFGFAWGRAAAGELRLLLIGRSRAWHLAVVAVNLAALLVPGHAVRHPILVLAWILPVTAWSSLGCRDILAGTEQVLLSVPGGCGRQLVVRWLAGIGLSLLVAAGPLVRLAAASDLSGLAGAAAAAAFVPALALALGAWSGGPKAFEALYTVLWYLGPLNGVALFDFLAIRNAAVAGAGSPVWTAAVAAGAGSLAWLGCTRRRRAFG